MYLLYFSDSLNKTGFVDAVTLARERRWADSRLWW